MARGRSQQAGRPTRARKSPGSRSSDRLLLGAFFLSGAAALGYEVLWTRLLSLALGSETMGVLGALTGFFGGLALGSWFLHERARRSPDPARLFVVLEVLAASYALASPHLLYALARNLPPLLGPAAGNNDTPLALGLGVAVAGLALLPGTLPMGATLAALVEARRRARPEEAEGRGVGLLYAANTLGATAGVLVSVFVVLPRLGLGWGSAALATLGLGAAALAGPWVRGAGRRPPTEEARDAPARGASRTGLLVLVTATGLAGIGLEVVVVQVLAQLLADTVYTFALALGAYLLGTALGSTAYGAFAERLARRGHGHVTAALLLAQAASVALTGLALRSAPGVLATLAPPGGSANHLAAEVLLCLWVFLVPTIVMGALFSHLFAPLAGQGVGRAYALNTLGGTAAPFLFGLAALRTLGYSGTLALVGAAYLALFAAVTWRLPSRRGLGWAAAALTSLLVVLFPRSLRLVPVPTGWELEAERASLMGLVMVTEETHSSLPGGLVHRRLQVNGRFRMGGSSAFIERRMGHLPLLFAPGAKNALFLGVGAGVTLGAVRHFPLERVEAVELVPEVLELLPWFEQANEGVAHDARVRLHAADARRFVAASAGRFDLVVGDLFHPERDGAGALYSREHFQAVSAHLAPGGVYAQWLPLYQLDLPTLRTIVRTFLDVFPEAHSLVGSYNALSPTLVLLGRTGPGPAPDRWPIPLSALRERLQAPVYAELESQDPRELLASFMLDREGLRALAGDASPNTDLEPHVLFDAPRAAYERPPDAAWRCLSALLTRRAPCPPELVSVDEPGLEQGLARFSRAVALYLEADVARVRDHGFSAAAVESYLRSYEAAPEFGPAGGVLQMLTKADAGFAEKVRARLARGAPAAR